MPFTPKSWSDAPSTSTPISAAALVDLENRLAAGPFRTMLQADIDATLKDAAAAVASLRTLGSGAQQALPGNDPSTTNARAPTGAAAGDLTGTYPSPTVATGAITDVKVATANKDGAAGTPSLRTLGTGAGQALAGSDASVTNSRAPSGTATGDLTGTYPAPTIAALAVTDAKVAAANKDGAAGVPSMRTLGSGATQAVAGNDPRLISAVSSLLGLNVKDPAYAGGAKGDGTTDDTAAFRAAIVAANALPAAIVVPQGTYKLTGALDFSGNCRGMVGMGTDVSVLNFAELGAVKAIDGGAKGITTIMKLFKNFTINGPPLPNGTYSPGRADWTQTTGIGCKGRFQIEHVDVFSFLKGISFNSDHNRLYNVRTKNNKFGVYYESNAHFPSDNDMYVGCHLDGNTFASVGIAAGGECGQTLFDQCHFGWGPYAIYLEYSATQNDNALLLNTFNQCTFEQCGNGVIFDEGNTRTVDGNTFITPSVEGEYNNTYAILTRAQDYTCTASVLTRTKIIGSHALSFSVPGAKGIWYAPNGCQSFFHDGAYEGIYNITQKSTAVAPCYYLTTGTSGFSGDVELRSRGQRVRGVQIAALPTAGNLLTGDMVSSNGPYTASASGNGPIPIGPLVMPVWAVNQVGFACFEGNALVNLGAAVSGAGNGTILKLSGNGDGKSVIASTITDFVHSQGVAAQSGTPPTINARFGR